MLVARGQRSVCLTAYDLMCRNDSACWLQPHMFIWACGLVVFAIRAKTFVLTSPALVDSLLMKYITCQDVWYRQDGVFPECRNTFMFQPPIEYASAEKLYSLLDKMNMHVVLLPENSGGATTSWPCHHAFSKWRSFLSLKISFHPVRTHLSGYDFWYGSCAIPDHRSLTVNEQWQKKQGCCRQTIRQALKQRLHRSKCWRLITSVKWKWKRKFQEKECWRRMCWCRVQSLSGSIHFVKPLNTKLKNNI